MRLGDLLKNCLYEETIPSKGFEEVEIKNIAYDSRRVKVDSIFVALRGDNHDGNDFILDAIDKGATGIVLEGNTPLHHFTRSPDKTLFFIRVKDARAALACLSNNFFGRPSERIKVIGVTGTNGKTTTTHLVRKVLETWGKTTGLIGTITYSLRGRDYPAIHTTPESVEFQSLLREMCNEGCEYVVTEVSSHALKQRRVDFTRFLIAVFTNLTRDHLDFHKTMEDYYISKRRLFTELLVENGTAIINLDDESGRRLLSDLSELRPDVKVITYGLNPDALISPQTINRSPEGSSMIVKIQGYDEIYIESPLIGIPNIYNILSALAVAISLHIPEEVIKRGIMESSNVKGRLEKVDMGQDFLCIIDYAHTPDALERLILTAREIKESSGDSGSRVITLFGCGGNRDKGKRPIMGRIATELSDYVIITSDNPRNEDPDYIISDIRTGIKGDNYEIIPDRAEAIKRAVEIAERGDIILIAGKGHEDYQEIMGKRERFSDRDVCINALRERIESCRL